MSVSNCSSASRGSSAAGDQGTEYYICDWYRYSNGGWNYYLLYTGTRADEVNALAAKYARAAANNQHIGYSQSNRYSMWEHLKASNYNPAEITIDCDADCSSSTTFIFKAVGYTLGIDSLKNLDAGLWTGNMKDAFCNAGFTAYSDSKYLDSPDYIKAGGVLLNTVHHVVINLDNGKYAGSDTPSTTNPYSREDIRAYEYSPSIEEMKARLQVLGYYDGEINRTYDDEFYNALVQFQKDNGDNNPDGNASATGWTWQVIDNKMQGHATIRPDFCGRDVFDMQSALNLFGYRANGIGGDYLVEDGLYGKSGTTKVALCQLQSDYGLGADGIASATGVTWKKVDELYNSIEQMYVNTNSGSLRVREKRSTESAIITEIAKGSWHKCTNKVNGWGYLHDVGGWVSLEYMK